jgi:hypothetical protein
VDKSHNSAEIDKRPIWIVEPKVQDGDLDMRICPLDTTSRWVSFTDTKPCTVCRGEDHKAAQCGWGMGRKFNTYWGKKKDNYGFKAFERVREKAQATPPADDDDDIINVDGSEDEMQGVEAAGQMSAEDITDQSD